MSNNEICALECIKSEPGKDIIVHTNVKPNAVSSYDNGIKTEADLKYVKEDEDLTIKEEETEIKEELQLSEDGDVNDTSFSVETATVPATKHTSEIHLIKTVNKYRKKIVLYQCSVCQLESSYKRVLEKHMRIHTGEKPFVCQICEYKCSKKSNLAMHMRTHTGEKPFFCQICEYKSSNKSDLARHIKIHTKEKPFVCQICEYKCSVKSSLARHIKMHNGEKPFVCHICEYKCAEKSKLKRHMKIHTEERSFVFSSK